MSDLLATLFHEWMPHARCVQNNPLVLGLQIPADALIFLAYMVLGLGMLDERRRFGTRIAIAGGKGTVHLYAWFGAFIFFCGLTHLMRLITTWYGVYVLDGLVSLVAAAASWGTIFASARVQRDGAVLWKRTDVDAALATFQEAIAATSAASREVQRELIRKHAQGGADGA